MELLAEGLYLKGLCQLLSKEWVHICSRPLKT